MNEIDVNGCPYKGGLECHIRDYPIEYCADVKIEDCHYKQLQRYKQAIEEIKEIAEKNLNIHTCAFKGCGYDLITKQILQKISEVEDANSK